MFVVNRSKLEYSEKISHAEYYDPELYPTMKEQKNFESNVFSKTHKADNEIAFLEGMTIVYKSSIDLFFYVVGSAQENELMLMSVLNCLFDSLTHILSLGRVILESDPQQVLQKVNYRADDNPLTEQSVAQHLTEKLALTTNVLQSAKEQIKWSILK
ncbi:PREDICTED: coatomer subunit zeta-2-like [Cyprinodon variegatus]|uniref:coatomer subunit zeta-2-like n=1 Tax=Cyprinodon variegatus TaxID=28743 RepID=UPI0007429035|nr:PREDICTED: coatomer subunit zeta-2-like [Cyprinodon variegatus]